MPNEVKIIQGIREGGPGGQIPSIYKQPDLSPIFLPIRVTSDYTVTRDRRFVLVDATFQNVSITLPAPPQSLPVTVKRLDNSGQTVTIRVTGNGTIDGASTRTLTFQWESATLVPFGLDWYVQ